MTTLLTAQKPQSKYKAGYYLELSYLGIRHTLFFFLSFILSRRLSRCQSALQKVMCYLHCHPRPKQEMPGQSCVSGRGWKAVNLHVGLNPACLVVAAAFIWICLDSLFTSQSQSAGSFPNFKEKVKVSKAIHDHQSTVSARPIETICLFLCKEEKKGVWLKQKDQNE